MARERREGPFGHCTNQRLCPDTGGRRTDTLLAYGSGEEFSLFENKRDVVNVTGCKQARLYCMRGCLRRGRPAGLLRRQAGMCTRGDLGGRFSDFGGSRRRDMLGAILSTALICCDVRWGRSHQGEIRIGVGTHIAVRPAHR
jgi:hypothetical protein